MRILTSSYWNKFNMEELSKHDGFFFEDLIEVLLNIEFGNGYWNKTRSTKDGGKDFVCQPLPNQWAECKMYDNRIQLTVISKTLVMAINEGIKRVLFFSYSKLTRGARQELSRFSCAVGMIIQVFDDELLEELILKNIKDYRVHNFFPDFVVHDYPQRSESHLLEQFFSKDIEIVAKQLLTEEQELHPRSYRVDVNQPCLFELTVSTQSVKKTDIQLDVSELVRDNNWFTLLNIAKLPINKKNVIKRRLSPGEVCAFRFYFTPIAIGSQIFPSFSVTLGHYKHLTIPVKIEVTRTERPVLIGQCIHNYLSKFQKCISSSNYVQASIVYGNSGVGKSRFIEECITRLLEEDYRICLLDGKNSRCRNVNKFVIELLVQLWRIPNPNIFDDAYTFETRSESYDKTEERLHNIIKHGLTDILFQEADLLDICLLLEKAIISKRMAILIDNIQALDATSLLLIDKIFDLIGRIGQGHFVFSFNKEELMYSQKASSVYIRFTEQRSNRNIHLYSLEKFSKSDVKMFVDTHLRGFSTSTTFSQQYPLLYEKICKNIYPSPLDLYLFFKLLWDEEIAKLDKEIFFITDFIRFDTALTKLNPNLQDILTCRFDKLQQDEEVLRIFLFLSFVGDVPIREIIQLLHVSYKSIDTLISGCWLRLDNFDRVDFYHPKIALFLLEKNTFLIEKQGNIVAKYLRQKGYAEHYPIMRFALAEVADKRTLFDSALQQINQATVTNARNQMLARQLYNYILCQSLSELSPSSYLPYIQHLCHLVSRENIEIIIDCFAKLNKLLENYKPIPSEVNTIFHLIRQHASYLCAIDPYRSIQILKNGLLRLNSLGKEFDTYKLYIKMNLNNRLSYCYRTISNKAKAEEIGLEALYTAEALGDIAFICLCNIDLGYIYWGDIKDQNNLLKYWKRVVKYYKENEKYLFEHEYYLAFSCILIESYLVAIEEKDYTKAHDLSNTVIQLSREKIDCMHHEILGLKAKAIWSIKQNVNTEQILATIDAMIDRCLISYDKKNLVKAYHLKAIVLDYMKKKESARLHFHYALQLLENKNYCSISDKALLWDAAAFYHRQRFPLSSFQELPINPTLWTRNEIICFTNAKWEMRLFMLFKDRRYNYPI